MTVRSCSVLTTSPYADGELSASPIAFYHSHKPIPTARPPIASTSPRFPFIRSRSAHAFYRSSFGPPFPAAPPCSYQLYPMATLVATPQPSIVTTDATPECAVCCEAFSTNTRSCRRRVSCPACDYAVCYKCVRTYLKDLEAAPRCMNCPHPWDEEFRHTVLSQAFCQILREKAIIHMVDREKALLPQTQIHLERRLLRQSSPLPSPALQGRRG